jgi:hypothetical protein
MTSQTSDAASLHSFKPELALLFTNPDCASFERTQAQEFAIGAHLDTATTI